MATEFDRTDPLGIIPDIDGSSTNIAYGLCLFLACALIASGIYTHFKAYGSRYVVTTAIVTRVDCNRFSINNHENEYHCVIEIAYSDPSGSGDVHKNSLTFVDNERFYEGDELQILVDRDNPLKIKTQVISDETMACFCCLLALFIIVVATGSRFIRIM